MDDLLLRVLRGGNTEAEAEQVEAWVRESPENEAYLRSLEQILTLAASMDDVVEPGNPPIAADLITGAEARRLTSKGDPPFRSPSRALLPLAVAATAAFVALGFLGYERWTSHNHQVHLAAEEFVTGAGEATTVRMSDGSVVRLGPESRLQVMPDGSGRQVVLVGRGFFAVATDENRPFRVHTPSGSIRVLGTRFQLEADSEDMRLVVVEGAVSLATRGSEVDVRAGEMTQVRSGRTGSVQQAPGIAERSADWMGEFLVFQETPLVRAAEEIEIMYGVEVRILEAVLAEKTLSMWFSSRPLEEVLTVVCSVIDASCTLEDGVVSISQRIL